jgi:hypothetical protein
LEEEVHGIVAGDRLPSTGYRKGGADPLPEAGSR